MKDWVKAFPQYKSICIGNNVSSMFNFFLLARQRRIGTASDIRYREGKEFKRSNPSVEDSEQISL